MCIRDRQVEGEGQHTLYLWLQDFAGNVDHNQHIRLLNAARYDATAPLTTFRASGTAGSNGWYSSPVEVTLTPSDAGSGVASTRYRINGGAWITGTQFTLGYDGQHLIEYHSSEVAGNIYYERAWNRVLDQITQGNRICEALMGDPLFPKTLVQMIGSGEETGKLDFVLTQISTFYDREVDTSLQATTSMIEPLCSGSCCRT